MIWADAEETQFPETCASASGDGKSPTTQSTEGLSKRMHQKSASTVPGSGSTQYISAIVININTILATKTAQYSNAAQGHYLSCPMLVPKPNVPLTQCLFQL